MNICNLFEISTGGSKQRRCSGSGSNVENDWILTQDAKWYAEAGLNVIENSQICLNKSISFKFHPLFDTDKELMEKKRKFTVGGPSIVFTCSSVVDDTSLRNA